MITKMQYFGVKHSPVEHEANADKMLAAVNCLWHEAADAGVYGYWIDPDTNSQISGSKGGAGDGGYRTPDSKTGAKSSTHREGHGCDTYDPERKLAAWCVLNVELLVKHDLYIEDPRWTPGWVHCQDVPPKSGKRVYIPASTPPLAPALPGQKAVPHTIK
jgi:hypothetical protein